jgi:FAD/FMN-containing dehydrogenase
VRETNWAGTHTYRAERVHRPATIEELQELLARTRHLRVLGSRHAFSDIADADELVSLDGLPRDIEVDWFTGTVSFNASLRYGELAEALQGPRLALHNLASLPHISVAGAVATATHGSGDRSGNLATAVAGLELITATGELLAFRRGDPDFDGLVVGLGALGPVTRITLDVEPAYAVRQQVFEGLRWDVLYDRFDEVTACGDSVSLFTHFGETAGNLWVKTRVGEDDQEPTSASVRRRPRSSCTRSPGSTRSTARPSSGCRGRGPIACRTSGWASRRRAARRSSPSTTCPAAMRSRRSTPCARSSRSWRRSSWCRRCAPPLPTPSG